MDLFEDLFGTMAFANDTERKKIKILFENYMENIPDNFYKNQFELAKEYPGSTYNEWVKILKHHANLVLNSATTLAEFGLSVIENKNNNWQYWKKDNGNEIKRDI